MKIYFRSEGGFGYFPGLNETLEINLADLPAEEAKNLEQLIQETDLPNASRGSSTTRGGDQKNYTIILEGKGEKHTVNLTDTESDPKLQSLISYLRKKQKESRSK